MTGASKILTVSYGTFSCTLEGFDEPFNTMKAIAEYFRDLAADDRYFGAEPPTPDPAMLHQIAKREIQRRVDAKIEENGVVLRAGFPDDAQDVVAEAPRAEPARPESPRLVEAAPAAESAAAKLSRIRAATSAPVAAPPLAPAPVAEAPALSDYSEDEHATPVTEAAVQTAPAFDEFDIDAFNDALLIDEGDLPEATVPAAETIGLADLANSGADLPEAEDAGADLADLALLDAPATLDAQLEEDVITATDQPEDAAEIAADDALLASLGALIDDDVQIATEGLTAPVAAEPRPEADLPTEDPDAADWSVETDLDRFDADEDLPAAEPATALIETPVQGAATPEPEAQPEAATPPRSEKLERARARVIRIRRADAPAPAVAPAPAAVVESAPVAAPVQEAPVQSLLSDELEAALQAELAALEAETTPEHPKPAQAPVAKVEPEPRKRLEPEAQDDAVSRLIAQTNSEMEGPETRRRQSAIAHLKAAVAATVAERQIIGATGASAEETRAEAYRSDLDRAVRPRRPGEAAAANAERPSPLVLVSEQRIDRPRPVSAPQATAPAAPQIVRPRRVSSVQLAPQPVAQTLSVEEPQAVELAEEPVNVFTDASPKSFAEYAEDRGATDLEALLEAAALYRAEVLKEAQFSRSDLFEAVTSLPATADVTLEDTLRSFGTLLRDGRIAKIRRGQFRLTGIADDADRAAG